MVLLHLDTDIGGDIDDICALALLLKWPDVEIAGVTTVLEHEGKRAGYARYALALAKRSDVPVAAGADVRLGCFRLEAGLPPGLLPEARYWPQPVPPSPGPLEAALDLLEHSIERNAIIVGIGPFTNLAFLERQHPGILRDAKLVLMGGSIRAATAGFPEWDYTMDYNVQCDCGAAQLVLASAHPTLIPIEITAQTALRRTYLPALHKAGPLGHLIARQAEVFAQDERNEERFGRTCAGLPHDIINFQHDPLAIAVALGWDSVTIERLPLALHLEHGWLRERGAAEVVTAVDAERCKICGYQRIVTA